MENGRWKNLFRTCFGMENGKWYAGSNIRQLVSVIPNVVWITILLIYFFSGNIHSQPVDSLVNEAIRNNPQLKALQSRIKAAEYKSESVDYLPPPTLGIEFNQVPINRADLWNEPISQSISLSQMFPLGGKLSAMYEAEKKAVSVAANEYESYKLKLIASIKSQYYEIWLMSHHLELRKNNLELLNQLLQSTDQLYQINRANYSDLLLINSEIAENKTEIKVLENEIKSELFMLNNLLGREITDNQIIIEHTLEKDTIIFGSDELHEILISQNPNLLKMNNMIEMNNLEIAANNKELIPDLMVQGMIMRMPRGMILTSKTPVHDLAGMGETETMYSLMASVTLPFVPWSSGKYYSKETELLASIEGLSSEKNNMQRELITELKSQLKKAESLNEEIQLISGNVIPLYRQTLDAQLMEFQNNRISINNIIETIRMVLMKEEELAELESGYKMTIADLEMVVGKKITGDK